MEYCFMLGRYENSNRTIHQNSAYRQKQVFLIYFTGCGTTITFHPTDCLIFLVGTEEGNIYKCSTAYASLYLATYEAHHMPVYKVDYNKFYPDIFISCSADWRVKIWEDKRR